MTESQSNLLSENNTFLPAEELGLLFAKTETQSHRTHTRGLKSISPIALLQHQLEQGKSSLLAIDGCTFLSFYHLELRALGPQNPQRLSSIIDPVDLAAQLSNVPRDVPIVEVTGPEHDKSQVITPDVSSLSVSSIKEPDSLGVASTKLIQQSTASFLVSGIQTVKNSTTISLQSSTQDLEGVYDRFLIATPGVVRLGRGYQSDLSPRGLGLGNITARSSRITTSAHWGAPDKKLGRRSFFGGFTECRVLNEGTGSSNASLSDQMYLRKSGGLNKDEDQIRLLPLATRVKKALQSLISPRR